MPNSSLLIWPFQTLYCDLFIFRMIFHTKLFSLYPLYTNIYHKIKYHLNLYYDPFDYKIHGNHTIVLYIIFKGYIKLFLINFILFLNLIHTQCYISHFYHNLYPILSYGNNSTLFLPDLIFNLYIIDKMLHFLILGPLTFFIHLFPLFIFSDFDSECNSDPIYRSYFISITSHFFLHLFIHLISVQSLNPIFLILYYCHSPFHPLPYPKNFIFPFDTACYLFFNL